MKLTNKYNLPKAVFDVLAKDDYSSGGADFSVTTLLKSPREVQLTRIFNDKLEADVSDRVWSLLGQAAHTVLEKHACENSMTEERMFMTICDRTISGQLDHYHDGCVTDYKVTSVWSIIRGSKIDDWTKQLNSYAYLFTQNNLSIDRLQVVAILRDWSPTEKLRSRDYPECPIVVIPITLWDTNKQWEYLVERVIAHSSAATCDKKNLPKCTAEDMWETDPVYAVKKKGRKSAVKLFPSEQQAQYFISDSKDRKSLSIEFRPGDRKKCANYCFVSSFCSQYQEFKRGH